MGWVTDDDLLPAAVAELYASGPEEFIKRRGELASRARAAGQAALAKRIAGLRKPTRSAWIINQLIRSDPARSARLADLGEQLRAAQSSLDGPAIRDLSLQRRQLIDALARQAFAVAGQPSPPAAIRDEVTATLGAALADPQVADRVRAGTLERAAHSEGFGSEGFGTAGAPRPVRRAAALRLALSAAASRPAGRPPAPWPLEPGSKRRPPRTGTRRRRPSWRQPDRGPNATDAGKPSPRPNGRQPKLTGHGRPPRRPSGNRCGPSSGFKSSLPMPVSASPMPVWRPARQQPHSAMRSRFSAGCGNKAAGRAVSRGGRARWRPDTGSMDAPGVTPDAWPGWLDQRLEAFQRHLGAERGLSPHTVRAYIGDVRSLLEYACRGGLGELAGLDIGVIRSWLAAQHSGGRARATLARRAASARAFTAFAHARGWLGADPGSLLGSPKAGRRLPQVLAREQMAAVLAAPAAAAGDGAAAATPAADDADPGGPAGGGPAELAAVLGWRDAAIMELLYASGIRVSELCGLDLGDIDGER